MSERDGQDDGFSFLEEDGSDTFTQGSNGSIGKFPLELTPSEKLLGAEVMVEIAEFPYPKIQDQPLTYPLGEKVIKISSSDKQGKSHSIEISNAGDAGQLYSVGYPLIDSSERLNKLQELENQYIKDVEWADEMLNKSSNTQFDYDTSLNRRVAAGDRWDRRKWEALNIPDKRTDIIKFSVSKAGGVNNSVRFDFSCNAESDYLRLPVNPWPLDLLTDKSIMDLVLVNIENTPESKAMWMGFLETNMQKIPLRAYVSISTKVQTLGGKI